MTVSAIIEQLYKSPDLDNCIRKMVRPDLWQDFKHELILTIYSNIPEQKLCDLHQRNELKFYVVRTIINLVKNKNQVYHRNYLLKLTELKNTEQIHLDELDKRKKLEDRELEIVGEIDRLDDRFNTFYYRELVKLIAKHGSMRAAARATGIEVSSISRAIKKVREHLNSIYNDPQTIEGIY